MTTQNRVKPGVRTGGQYAPTQHAESGISLSAAGSTAPATQPVSEDAYHAYSGRIRAEAELNSRVETRLMVAAVAGLVQEDQPEDDTLIMHDYGGGTSLEIVGSTGPHGQIHTRDDLPALGASRLQYELGPRLRSDWGDYRMESGGEDLEQIFPLRDRRGRYDPAGQVRTLPISPTQLRPGHADPAESVLADERDDNTLSGQISPAGMAVYGFTLDEQGRVADTKLDTGCHSEPTDEQRTQAREHVQSVLDLMPDNTRTGTRWYRHADTGAPSFAGHIGIKER